MSDDFVNNYNIIVLGPTGSGKTVYLASMYKRLSTQSPDLPFFIETSGNQSKLLIEKYNRVANPSATWPQGTLRAEISEWKFICSIRPPSGPNFQALSFTYLDYAGGRITDILEDESEEVDQVEKRATEADAVLGLIDGQKLLELMKNPSSTVSKTFILRDLSAMLTLIQKCRGPIHFVITKWDLLEDLYSLSKIRDALLRVEEFNNIIWQCRQRKEPVWLIPVSSVGKGFAELQSDGLMRKTGADIKPLYVEMPFCCVFPDCLRKDLETLRKVEADEKKAADEQSKQLASTLAVPIWRRIAGGAFRFAGSALNILLGLDPTMFYALGSYFDLLASNKEYELRKERERLYNKQKETLRQVVDRSTAVNHALTCFEKVQLDLKLKFPDAFLS